LPDKVRIARDLPGSLVLHDNSTPFLAPPLRHPSLHSCILWDCRWRLLAGLRPQFTRKAGENLISAPNWSVL